MSALFGRGALWRVRRESAARVEPTCAADGRGGYDGTLVTGLDRFTLQPTSIEKQGFVTLGSDGGHQATGRGFNGQFALDAEALLNFGQQSIKKAHNAAILVITKAYGRAPERFYFIGGSQGGHEAGGLSRDVGESVNGRAGEWRERRLPNSCGGSSRVKRLLLLRRRHPGP
jgi:hypothetical protein